jgi:hypothetical protein
MSPNAMAVLGTVLSIGAALGSAAPAAARTTGKESFRGQLIAPAESGTRHVAASIVVAAGVFTGAGRLAEVANRPGDPDNMSRDDLVFPSGTIHIRNTSQQPQISIDQQTCAIQVNIKQSTKVQGGTGRFRQASGTFTGTVREWGVAARNADGTCSMQSDLLLAADALSARGTLSF